MWRPAETDDLLQMMTGASIVRGVGRAISDIFESGGLTD